MRTFRAVVADSIDYKQNEKEEEVEEGQNTEKKRHNVKAETKQGQKMSLAFKKKGLLHRRRKSVYYTPVRQNLLGGHRARHRTENKQIHIYIRT